MAHRVRLQRLTALLTAGVLLQVSVLSSGLLCARIDTASPANEAVGAQGPAPYPAAVHAMAHERSGVASLSDPCVQQPGETPCRVPSVPSSCHTMTACALLFGAPPPIPRTELTRLVVVLVATITAMPTGPAIPPVDPPPRT